MAEKAAAADTAIILAGGKNSRMARPKAFLKVGGVPIIIRQTEALRGIFPEIIVVANDPGPYERLGLRAVPDAEAFRGMDGPMAGICTGLLEMPGEYGFVIACDMPFVRPELALWMSGQKSGRDAVLPRVNGYVEPLFGFYSRRAAEVFRRALEAGERSIQRVLGGLDVRYADGPEMTAHDPELKSFINLNTPEDVRKAERLLEEQNRKSFNPGRVKCLAEK